MSTVFCDRLTIRSLRAASSLGAFTDVLSLDPLPSGLRRRILYGAAAARGLTIGESPFFAGDLRTAAGECVYLTARRLTTDIALHAARGVIEADPVLAELNRRFGRDRIALHIARGLWRDVEFAVMRILIVEAIARGTSSAMVLLSRPRTFDGALLQQIEPAVGVRFYESPARIAVCARLWIGAALRALKAASTRRGRPGPPNADDAVLMVQEDDLSICRDYRSQPHWIFPEDPAPAFPVYVLASEHVRRLGADTAALRARRIKVIEPAEAWSLARVGLNADADDRWRTAIRRCAFRTLVCRSIPGTVALGAVWRLLARARTLDGVCRWLRVKVFVTGESHLIDCDAMQLVSAASGTSTVTYQYSNLAFPTPPMMSTADSMLLFSRHYRQTWSAAGIEPHQFAEVGYLYDRSFAALRPRAATHRRRLREAGATFVVCYFDENYAKDKYGLTSAEEHRRDVATLIDLLLKDGSVGLIVKTQFEANSPSRLYAGDPMLPRAHATGRYLELRHGAHRNVVFPAEAAMASDMVIGHAVGATAVLEAACAGARAVMLNPYSMCMPSLYDRAPIVFPTLDLALRAIAEHRRGAAEAQRVGDWSDLLSELDPFRDGRAAVRTRHFIEDCLRGVEPVARGGLAELELAAGANS